MSEFIRTLTKEDDEYRKLLIVCTLLNSYTQADCVFYVEDTYFDYGQDWKWTTILCCPQNSTDFFHNYHKYQYLTPAVQQSIFLANTLDEIFNITDKLLMESNKRGW